MPIQMGDGPDGPHPLTHNHEKLAVCILAAGVAKRLEPISAVIAKPAFPLGGRVPIAELWVRKFVQAGITRMAMNLHRVPESIRGYFGDGKRFVADISYVLEDTPSGTLGGAIKMVKKLRESGYSPERVFIPSGDVVSGIGTEQLGEMIHQHAKSGAVFTMMLAPIPWDRRGDFGTVILDGIPAGADVAPRTYRRIVDFVEKDPESPSNENNASNYLIETSFLMELEPFLTEARIGIPAPCYDFGKHVLMGMQGRVPHLEFLKRRGGDLYGYEPGSAWYDVGNKRDYLEVNRAVVRGEVHVDLPYTRYPWGWMGDNVEIDFGRVTVNWPVVIGNGCSIFPGAEIGPNVVLGDGWVVHRKARIADAVLWPYYNCGASSSATPGRMSRIREVREGVEIETAIIVGGIIASDIRARTVDVLPNWDLDIRGIDWIPGGPRA